MVRAPQLIREVYRGWIMAGRNARQGNSGIILQPDCRAVLFDLGLRPCSAPTHGQADQEKALQHQFVASILSNKIEWKLSPVPLPPVPAKRYNLTRGDDQMSLMKR